MHARRLASLLSATLLAATTAATLAALPSEAHAGGFQIPEVGTRRTGMGAVIGRPDDGSAVFHNPAGITLSRGVRVYVHAGGALIRTEFNLRPWDQQDDGTYRSDEFLGQSAGANGYYDPIKPSRAMGVIPMLVASAQISPKLFVAGSLYVGNATGAAFSKDDVTRYHLIEGYVIAPQANLTVGYKVHPRLALGASAGIINVRVKGERYFYPILQLDGGSELDLRQLGYGDQPLFKLDGETWEPTWNAGILAEPIDGLTIGAAMTGKIETKYEGNISLTSSEDPDTQMVGRHKTTQYMPLTFGLGINYDVHPNVEVGVEGRYWYYKPYKEQRTEIDGFLIPELVTQKNFHNSKQISGGVRVHDLKKAPGFEFMLGGHYDKTPAPAQTLTLDQPSFDHPGLHSGIRYVRGDHRFGLTYTRYWYLVPTVEDSITLPPLNFSGHGTSNIISISYEGTFGDGALWTPTGSLAKAL
jgi:long-subunit fatty acid transport protein